MTSDNVLFGELYVTLWNFAFGEKVPELYGTLTGLMELKNCALKYNCTYYTTIICVNFNERMRLTVYTRQQSKRTK